MEIWGLGACPQNNACESLSRTAGNARTEDRRDGKSSV